MSIGLVTVAYGVTYRAFLPAWIEAVNQLNTPPDRITIVTDDVSDVRIHAAASVVEVEVIAAKGKHKHHPQVYVNQAIAATDTDWICKMDIDDKILPHAFDCLRNLPCDVYMFGIRHQGQDMTAQQITYVHVLQSPHNLVFSGSPFRKWVWTSNQYKDMIYEDWAFWIGCAKQQARFLQSETIDYEYVSHGHNISEQSDDSYWQQIVRSLR